MLIFLFLLQPQICVVRGQATSAAAACLRVTHTFVESGASAMVDSSGRTLTSTAARGSGCGNGTRDTLTLRVGDTACALQLNSSVGVRLVGCEAAATSGVTLLGSTSRSLYILGLRFDAATFRSGGVLRAGAFVGSVSRLDDDGSWNAFAAGSGSNASALLVSAFNLSLPVGVALQGVALRVPSADDLAPSSLAPSANWTLEPQSWAEANSALAIGLGALGIFVLLAAAFFGAVFVWNKRRKASAARNELALYGVGASVHTDRKRRASLTDVVMIDAADDRVQRAKSAHALLAQSAKNQDAPSIRHETTAPRDDLFKSAQA